MNPRLARTVRLRCGQGHALLSVLLAMLLVSAGAVTAARWTVWLLQTERSIEQRERAGRLLQSALETGTVLEAGTRPAHDTPTTGTRTTTLPDGTQLRVRETRLRATDGSDPARGVHVLWTAEWEDARGQAQTLVLRTYWAPTPRIY